MSDTGSRVFAMAVECFRSLPPGCKWFAAHGLARETLLRWCRASALATLFVLSGCRDRASRAGVGPTEDRIVSLSPAVTATLFALGLGQKVVAVSDFCHEPAIVEGIPRVGTVFSPRYESVAAAHPTIIVAERIDGTRVQDFEKLCATATYRWLSYDDVLTSTRQLGQRFGRERLAEELIANYETVLRVAPNEHAPRVLLALAQVPGQLSEIWFIRRNSIHGRALEAAGATNAIARDVSGPPRIGLEQAIALDPDAVILLDPSATENPRLLEDWKRLSGLRAVQRGRLALVAAPELEVPGPRIARLIERLRKVLDRFATSSPDHRLSGGQALGNRGVIE
jgi:ABC-type Fe3+-hydroxamate transport system substrate-binding protein